MMIPYYVSLVTGILFGIVGQLALKSGAERTGDIAAQFLNSFTIVGFGFYGVAAILYTIALKRIPISVAFPSVSISYAAVVLAAHFLWQEPIGVAQIAGLVLISSGILLLYQ
jgi:undecaprenyl phosphate-alpha-L-ara4N flippase subunit ArnE